MVINGYEAKLNERRLNDGEVLLIISYKVNTTLAGHNEDRTAVGHGSDYLTRLHDAEGKIVDKGNTIGGELLPVVEPAKNPGGGGGMVDTTCSNPECNKPIKVAPRNMMKNHYCEICRLPMRKAIIHARYQERVALKRDDARQIERCLPFATVTVEDGTRVVVKQSFFGGSPANTEGDK